MAERNKLLPIEGLSGPLRVVALSLQQQLTPGTPLVIAEALRTLATTLESGSSLSEGEARYLANALRKVAADPEKFGEPFGYRTTNGRPGMSALHRLALGKRVDELNRPQAHGLDSPPVALTDNSTGAGAYSLIADEFGCSQKAAERAHAFYKKVMGATSKTS